MTRKEYIENLENLIINKVKYHSPKVYGRVDYSLLDAVGIDGQYPIFIFNKPLDKLFYSAFYHAKKDVDFNLILTERPKISNRKIKKLPKTFLLFKEEMGSNLGYTLEQLNINYLAHSNYKYEFKEENLKINGKEIKFDYQPYYNYKKGLYNGIICDLKCFVLNGKNFIINCSNTTNEKKELDIEFHLPLPRGYYIFKRESNSIEIENLTSKVKAFFNFNFKNCKITFSTMNGIDSCTFASINFYCKLSLLGKETKKIYFNFGENKYCLFNPKDINYFYEISQRKMNEIFNVKVTTKDEKFDQLFNNILPKSIWESWRNFTVNEECENNYLKMRKELFNKEENGIQISKSFKGLKEMRFFHDNKWKRVFIVHNKLSYLFADRVKYYNFTLLTKEIFDKNNEIYLSFAE